MNNLKNKKGNETRNNHMNFRVTNEEKKMIMNLKGEQSLTNFIIKLIENSDDDDNLKNYLLDKIQDCYKNEIKNVFNDIKIIQKRPED